MEMLATSLAVFSNGHIDHRKGKMQIDVETSKLDQRRVFVFDDDEVTHAALQFMLHDETETYPGRQPPARCDRPPAHSTARGGAAGDSVLDTALRRRLTDHGFAGNGLNGAIANNTTPPMKASHNRRRRDRAPADRRGRMARPQKGRRAVMRYGSPASATN
jgi:hypothetical protein